MRASPTRCRNGAYGGGCGGRAAGCRVWRTGPDTGSAGSRSGCRRSHNGGIRGSAPTDGRSSSNTADRRGRMRIARRWPCTISRWPGASRRAHRPHLVSNRPPATGQTFCAAFVNCSRLIHEKCVNRSCAVNAGVWRGRSPVVLLLMESGQVGRRDDVDLYARTYSTVLRTSGEVHLRAFERAHP